MRYQIPNESTVTRAKGKNMKEKIYRNTLICLLTLPCMASYSQNVGIGTNTPTERLEIAGNLKADTLKPTAMILAPNAGPGKILTSDDVGNATWENSSYAPPPEENIGYGVWGDCANNGNISAYNPVADEDGNLNDYFGHSVSISGNFAIVGAYGDEGAYGEFQGSASFYQFDGSAWVFLEKIVDADGAANDYFGNSVTISSNYAIVGSLYDDGPAGLNQGSISIYQFDGLNWILMQKITDDDGAAYDYFGSSIVLYDDYAIVGSLYDDGPAGLNQGSVSIYHFDGSTWVFLEKIFDPDGATGDLMGGSISISGNFFIIGSSNDDGAAGLNQGSASIYHFDGSDWSFMQKLTDATGDVNDYFGNNVAISGNYTIVGSAYDNIGSNADQGSVSIYHFDGNSWFLLQKISDVNGAAEDFFGISVSISGNYIIVGASYNNVSPNLDQGSAHIFFRLGMIWQKLQDVFDPSGTGSDFFSGATALDSSTKRFMLGAIGFGNNVGKVVFGKIN
ncbi:MAG: FG-GAP repeat protein [Saprospiraceae bacterium]|nr:FG-GAP repeat protein [Saprospiraceae bacterium]